MAAAWSCGWSPGRLHKPRPRLRASLTAFGLFCQPTLYDGQRLAQR